ncbi:MAG TPA: single-stranded DNA-binding protein [Xanthobacteraceae bacterium]|nr:single-stranded DNA-binding protein [Xanthobacteraceae bacterium]
MPGINQATILGRVGKNPEIKTFGSGDKIATFSVATSETWRDKQTGERKEKTQWHNVVVKNGGLVGVVEKYVSKGDQIFVQGAIETRKWTDQNGAERYATEIVLGPFNSRLELIGGGNKADDGDAPRSGPTRGAAPVSQSGIVDDEIPFSANFA